jgi:hypothetical protein
VCSALEIWNVSFGCKYFSIGAFVLLFSMLQWFSCLLIVWEADGWGLVWEISFVMSLATDDPK